MKKIILLSLCMLLVTCHSRREIPMDVRRKIQHIEKQAGGTIAIAFEDLKTGMSFFFNEREQMHAASTMKVPVMIEVFKQAKQGKCALNDSLLVKNEFRSIVDGSIYSMDIGVDSDDSIYDYLDKRMSIRDLVFQMITVSSNLATNILVDLVGAKNVMKTMKEIDAANMLVLRGVEDIKAYRKGLSNRTDAISLLNVMKAIAQRKVVSSSACNEMIQIMQAQKFRDKIPGKLPKNVPVANKTGHITAIDHDAAIVQVTPDHEYVLVVLTKGIENHKKACEVIAEISKMIFDEVDK